jgi:hypothetical protein
MTQSNDQGLSTLLHEAVSDVEPSDRLTQIRAGVRRGRTRRLWLVSGGGAVIAAAATVAAVALVSSPKPTAGPDPGPATHQPTVAPPTSSIATDSPTFTPEDGVLLPVYYLGEAGNDKLYREFHRSASTDPAAVLAELVSAPKDPDYRTLWPAGSFAWVKESEDLITVQLADGSLHDRPEDMSPAEAEASIQQVIYTLQAMAQKRLPVQFTYLNNPIDQVLGVPTSEPLANAPILETLSRVNLNAPAEGVQVTDTLEVEGVSNSFEANVAWRLEDASGTEVDSGAITAEGYMAEKLFPFHDSLDVSSLDPGTYTFIVMTDDPSGAGNVDSDSRTVVIR